MIRLRVYGWPDGEIVQIDTLDEDRVWLNLPRGAPNAAQIEIVHGRAKVWSVPALNGRLDPLTERRIRAFLIDLGVQSDPSGVVRMPTFVPDALWERRYEEADRFVFKDEAVLGRRERDGAGRVWTTQAKNGERYLGVLSGLEIYDPDFRGTDAWSAMWVNGGPIRGGDLQGPYFHQVVDRTLDEAMIFPEGVRTAWLAEHAEFGSWIFPSAEEVELFRLLGEDLPLLWPADRLRAWLEERS